MNDWIQETAEGVIIRVRVTPRAKKDKIETPAHGSLPVKLNAPPVDNKANAALVALVAKKLGLAKSSISIKSGDKSRNKTLIVQGVTKKQVLEKGV